MVVWLIGDARWTELVRSGGPFTFVVLFLLGASVLVFSVAITITITVSITVFAFVFTVSISFLVGFRLTLVITPKLSEVRLV